MPPMKLRRFGFSASFALVVITACLGACGPTQSEACGNAGDKTGTCVVGPNCPSGQLEILIVDPSDECPGTNAPGQQSYICCGPPMDGASAFVMPTGDASSSSH
jgi:hypothetical protein